MGTPLRLLIIEDSDDDAFLLSRTLRQGGYDVMYERVASAASLASALHREWDMVISDFSMPHFSGSEALKLVREQNSDTPFIFVSGTIGEEMAVSALKTGAQDYVMKSNMSRLLPAIDRELRETAARRERRRLETQVNQLSRFEAIGRLAGGIAHDFNNMIGAMMGWAEMGYLENPPGSKAQDRFGKIFSQAERAAVLTRQLLAFARRQLLQQRNADLNEIVRESLNLLRSVIGEQIEIQLSLMPNLWVAWADATQVEQVLMNLCLNARDAMPDGGKLCVQTMNVELHEIDCKDSDTLRPGRYVALRVTDSGCGLDEETIEHIFEPFFTTKEIGKGTGLGLATVYGIVRQHEGFVQVQSSPGKGAAFTVHLSLGSGLVEAQTKESHETPSRGHERILVAEDHEGVLQAAQEILETLGYSVLTARKGQEAVETFRREHDSVDLILLNVVMPVLNGPQAYDEIRKIKPDVPVIFTTGYATEANLIQDSLSDQEMILPKPYGVKDLAYRLQKTLGPKRLP